MTGREYLRHIRRINLELRSKEAEMNELRRDCYALSATDYSADRITGGTPSDISDKIVKLSALMQKINRQWDDLIRLRAEASDKINAVPRPEHRVLLIQRYVLCKSWKDVAALMFISEDNVRGYMHRQALRAFQKVNTF